MKIINTLILSAMLSTAMAGASQAASTYHLMTAWTDSQGFPFIRYFGEYSSLSVCEADIRRIKSAWKWNHYDIDHKQHRGWSNGYKSTLVCREVRS